MRADISCTCGNRTVRIWGVENIYVNTWINDISHSCTDKWQPIDALNASLLFIKECECEDK